MKRSARNCWIWRIVDAEPWYSYVREDMLNGVLRQGWSPQGVDITKGVTAYIKALEANGWSVSDEEDSRGIGAVKRFKVLEKMLRIQVGDRIIVPKVSAVNSHSGDHFIILEVIRPYHVSQFGHNHNDFNHGVGVKTLASYNYYDNDLTATLAEKLNAKYPYGAAVNRIGSTNAYLRSDIEKLINLK